MNFRELSEAEEFNGSCGKSEILNGCYGSAKSFIDSLQNAQFCKMENLISTKKSFDEILIEKQMREFDKKKAIFMKSFVHLVNFSSHFFNISFCHF